MVAEIEELRAELAELRQQTALGAGDGLQMAIREVRAQFEVPIENAKMSGPCAHINEDGRVCGLPWKTNGEVTHPKSHSWRKRPVETKPTERNYYSKDDGVSSYVTDVEAAAILDIQVEELGTIPSFMVAGKTVYRRSEIEDLVNLVKA
jgi:hypothetical protein